MFSLVVHVVNEHELARLQERLLHTERMMERIVSAKSRGSGRYRLIFSLDILVSTAHSTEKKMSSHWDKSA